MADSDLAYLDGVDADTLNLKLTRLNNAFGGLGVSYPLVNIPQRPGVVIGRSVPDVGPKLILIEGHNAIQSTLALADTIVETLKDAVREKLTQITFGHQPTRCYYGVAQDFLAQPKYENQGPIGWASIQIPFLCEDPYAVDLTPSVTTGIAGERVPIPQGTGPTYCDLYVITGTNPTITLRRHDGTSLGTIAWTLTSSAGDYVHVATLDGFTCTKSVSSVISSNMSVLTAGYTPPVFSPRDANRALSSWATVETSSGTLMMITRRRWE